MSQNLTDAQKIYNALETGNFVLEPGFINGKMVELSMVLNPERLPQEEIFSRAWHDYFDVYNEKNKCKSG